MALVTFQVIDGVDKGRTFHNLPTPVTLGREEGNMIRLNDERVSRFHAKVQEDQSQVVLTDLDSTNGTCVNGEPIQLRLLRPGDRVSMGRSTLLFGSPEEIAVYLKGKERTPRSDAAIPTVQAAPAPPIDAEDPGTTGVLEEAGRTELTFSGHAADMGFSVAAPETSALTVLDRSPPKLPRRLTPAQAAQLSEMIDFLHRLLANATDGVRIPEDAQEAHIPVSHWQQIQAVLSYLAKYSRQVAEPDESAEN